MANRLAVAIETSSGPAVDQLLESGVTVYPVNPMNAKRYRERKCSSGNKTDRHDAWALADALRLDGHGWRVLAPQNPLIAEQTTIIPLDCSEIACSDWQSP